MENWKWTGGQDSAAEASTGATFRVEKPAALRATQQEQTPGKEQLPRNLQREGASVCCHCAGFARSLRHEYYMRIDLLFVPEHPGQHCFCFEHYSYTFRRMFRSPHQRFHRTGSAGLLRLEAGPYSVLEQPTPRYVAPLEHPSNRDEDGNRTASARPCGLRLTDSKEAITFSNLCSIVALLLCP